MTEYARSAEEALNDTAMDAYVLAVTAKQGRLNVKAADELVDRLRSHAANMIDDGDREMLRAAADGFERLGDRIKAGAAARTRAKASARTPAPAPQPDFLAMSRAADLEQMASAAAPFSVNGHEESERRRAEVQNQQARDARRRHEEQRRAQVAQDEPETPWWR